MGAALPELAARISGGAGLTAAGTLADRVAGCVLGLALGDALGAPFEFRRADDVPDPLPAFELPWKGFPPGTTTDDTAMARNLVRSLVERRGFDPADVAARHVAWFRTGPPDVGAQTRRVLARVAAGERAEDAARAEWEARGPEVSAGNGSVMYCAPLGAAYAHRPNALIDAAPRLSAVTHHDERCRTAVLAVTLATAAAVRGEPPGSAAAEALRAVLDREGGEELEFLAEEAGRARRVDGPDMGFCLFTAGLGLQTLARAGSWRQIGPAGVEAELRRLVLLGGDTDTNAAVAGALLGAAVGHSGLPPGWLGRLVDRDAIEREARGLVPLAERTE
ncbi:MAG: ADP-ribosylglycohydrolase family protein [Actinomycetota bacterium]|nr:ADP-ribosylglycohydrolase family protein [Actinomycetota bacterium]